jgi:hypothetical protein
MRFTEKRMADRRRESFGTFTWDTLPAADRALQRCSSLRRNGLLNSYGAARVVGLERHLLHAHCINRHMFYSLGIKWFLIGGQGKPNLGVAFVGLTDHSSYAGM